MNKDDFDFVSARDLRIGLFVDLELGWTKHPFPSGRFKISSEQQLQTLRSLPVDRYRYVPAKSELLALPASNGPDTDSVFEAPALPQQEPSLVALSLQAQAAQACEIQRQSLAACERRFNESAQKYGKALDLLPGHPYEAAQLSQKLVQDLVTDMQADDVVIRLLTDGAGDKASTHSLNVTVMSLLLGRALGLQGADLHDLGLAALLHDIGKLELPERLRRADESFSLVERNAYQSHVAQSVRLAQHMGLGQGTIQAIAQHHEQADGGGFPLHLKLDAMGMPARILALVNRYDGLCNPVKPRIAMTPHEALAMIFSQQKKCFDASVLSAFIRMLGVYPPGSVVQLNDERFAMVVAVNAARPLKPRVIVHDAAVPRHDALVMDLEYVPNASIRRSLKPASLSALVQDYLQPRQRLCYFFEAMENANALSVSA